MRYAQITHGIVTNIIVAGPEFAASIGAIEAPAGCAIGWHYDGTAFSSPAPATPTVADFVAALEDHYDTKAKERRYDDRYTCALRAGYPGPFQAEGTAFAVWMDDCNALGYTTLAQVLAGQRAAPESTAALIAELPPMVWPA